MKEEDIISQSNEENNDDSVNTALPTEEKEGKEQNEKLQEETKEKHTEVLKNAIGINTLIKILGGEILNAQQLRKQVILILIIFGFVIVYISNRYKCLQFQIKIDKLNKEVKDTRYKALSLSSELTEISRESRIEQLVRNAGDSTLHKSKQPPYIINVSEK